MNRWDFLFVAGTLASIFVPVLVAIFSAALAGERRTTKRDRRIADYRKSPESHLLILNY